jgi:transposase
MDNVSFYHTERIEQMCRYAGVKLVYLPLYSPDLNPIKGFFAELEAFLKRHWQIYKDDRRKALTLSWNGVSMWCSARGHFRHAGLEIEEPP